MENQEDNGPTASWLKDEMFWTDLVKAAVGGTLTLLFVYVVFGYGP